MSLGLRRLAATTAGALAVALAIGTAAPAAAQIDTASLADLTEEQVGTIFEGLGEVPIGSTAGLIGSVGSAEFPLGTESSAPVGTPTPVLEGIGETKLVEIERYRADEVPPPDTDTQAYEYWIVQSKAMQRRITVEVVPSRITDDGPAPVLYMLDGVGAPISSTGWAHQAYIADRMADENVHIVNPAGAYASYYSDWEKADPVLGYNKWETFLTEELPAVVKAELDSRDGADVSDKAAVGGISMGGQAAMHLAATYPELYDGVMSFSGFYSTMDQLGYQTVRLSVETRGGNVENMWGPHRSKRWRENDTISQVKRLKDTAVYFSSGNGVAGNEDYVEYDFGAKAIEMATGLILERGVLESTKSFEKELKAHGIKHQVDYSETGMHNWPNFLKNFDAGWEYIKPALYGGNAAPGTGGTGASGSSGSAGSTGSSGSLSSSGS